MARHRPPGDVAPVQRIVENWTAVRLWLAVFFVGFAVGWVTVQPWWPIGACAVGGFAAFVIATINARWHPGRS